MIKLFAIFLLSCNSILVYSQSEESLPSPPPEPPPAPPPAPPLAFVVQVQITLTASLESTSVSQFAAAVENSINTTLSATDASTSFTLDITKTTTFDLDIDDSFNLTDTTTADVLATNVATAACHQFDGSCTATVLGSTATVQGSTSRRRLAQAVAINVTRIFRYNAGDSPENDVATQLRQNLNTNYGANITSSRVTGLSGMVSVAQLGSTSSSEQALANTNAITSEISTQLGGASVNTVTTTIYPPSPPPPSHSPPSTDDDDWWIVLTICLCIFVFFLLMCWFSSLGPYLQERWKHETIQKGIRDMKLRRMNTSANAVVKSAEERVEHMNRTVRNDLGQVTRSTNQVLQSTMVDIPSRMSQQESRVHRIVGGSSGKTRQQYLSS